MDEQMWIDEHGKKVETHSFFSKVYVDEEMRELSYKYNIWECDGNVRLSSLGKAQFESIVARILLFARLNIGNPTSLVGVLKKELEKILENHGEQYFLRNLIDAGMLREKLVMGKLVIFPTEELLKNQRISLRK